MANCYGTAGSLRNLQDNILNHLTCYIVAQKKQLGNVLVSCCYFGIVKVCTENDNKVSFEAEFFLSQRNMDPKHIGLKLCVTQQKSV